MGFDFAHTCPVIDREIGTAKEVIVDFIAALIEECSPLLPEKRIEELAGENGDSLYAELEGAFESVRSTNEDMRSVAEKQISDLQDELSDSQQQIEDLQAQIVD